MRARREIERGDLDYFGNALREFLGLRPLYEDGVERKRGEGLLHKARNQKVII